MRILFFVASLYGGGMERIAALLASHLVQQHQVIVADFSDNTKTYPIDSQVKIIDISPQSPIRAFHRMERMSNIKRTIKTINPDIIISFSVSLNAKVIKANRRLKKKIIVSERTTVSRSLNRTAEHARKKLYPLADCVVYVTKEDYDHSPHVKNKTYIYNPLTLKPYDNYEDREKSIITIGGLGRWHVKGFDLLLEAWHNVCLHYPEWCLEFLGHDGPGPIHDLVKKYQLEKQVHFLGRSDDIQNVLRRKSVYVLSSRNEGFPNSLVEAMSQGCACLAFDCQTGPKEIITDGVNGLLVENGSVEDLTQKLKNLLTDERLRETLSKNAVEEVRRFNKETIMDQWDELIEIVYKKKS